MPEEALDPYAPPEDSSPAGEPAGTWTVAGDCLMVRDGARLPEVNLEGEAGARDLTPTARQFVVAPSIGRALFAIVPAIGMGVWISHNQAVKPVYGFALIFVLMTVFKRFFGRLVGPGHAARVQGYASAATLAARARRGRWRRLLLWAGLLTLLLTLLGVLAGTSRAWHRGFYGAVDVATYGFGLAVTLLLASAVWQLLDQGLRCTGVRDGWLEVRGVPPASLAELARRVQQGPAPGRKRRLCTVFQYQLPLGLLAGKYRWNPRIFLTLAILKARRSPRLERKQYHWSESRVLPPAEADASLRRRWEEIAGLPEFEGWTEELAERMDYPAGDLRTEGLVLASPDRRHFAILIMTRVSFGNFFGETQETAFRCWTSDGRSVLTCSQPMLGNLPPSLDALRVQGRPPRILAAHLGRPGAQGAQPVADADALLELIRREADEQHELWMAAGIHGPYEEVEIAGEPA
ncbi:hypothetical protein [Luteolibacter marinus]|uniref:hypothetical protein n=1 Tax=Luteolibacter marinus TaxID=2776705 RepID=UPI001868ED65|nr:hypothetical protein [Luteolibacter marinus]